jgi:hypothetical protein
MTVQPLPSLFPREVIATRQTSYGYSLMRQSLVGARPCLTAGTDVGVVDEAQVIFRGSSASCAATGEPGSDERGALR